MSELVLDFPNSQKHEATENPWDTLAGQAFMEVNLSSEEESLKQHRMAVIAEKQKFQTIAKELCGDTEGAITNGSLEIYQDRPIQRDGSVEKAYCDLTETQLSLLDAEDQFHASPKRADAEQFADSINPGDLGWPIANEVTKVCSALRQLHEVKEKRISHETGNWINDWLSDMRDRRQSKREAMDTLESCGYVQGAIQTGIFDLILQEAKAINYSVPTKNSNIENILGRKRACDYQEAKLLLEDEATGASCRRALREAGYKQLPESWNDENFSTSDIAEICAIARESVA